jgi:hypothetical protein
MAVTINASTSAGLISTADTSGILQLQTANTTALTINASQNVGIGTSSPSARLHVRGSSSTYTGGIVAQDSTNNFFTFYANGNNGVIGTAGTISFASFDGSSQRMLLDTSGNLGIGTSSPNVKLQVSQTNTTSVGNGSTYLGLGVSENGVGGKRLIGFGYKSTNNYYPAYLGFVETFNAGSTYGDLVFYTRSVNSDTEPPERARIDSSGNLLVGKTTTSISTAGFSAGVNDVSGSAAGVIISTVNAEECMYLNRLTSDGTIVSFRRDNSQKGTIAINGSTTSYNTSSDYRLKNTIAPMTGALAKVTLLKPCTYKWNADGSDGEGFIAHELAEVMPQCVTGEKDAVDSDGNPQYQGIDTSFLVATLTAAIQEQQAIIETLKADVAALKG